MKVAVIDDGIGNVFFNSDSIAQSIEIDSNLKIKNVNIHSHHTHGTLCAAIIKKYYPEVEFTSIKIIDEKTHKSKKEQLIKALEWCISNSIKVINLSIGTIDYRDFEDIRVIVDKVYRKGGVIVAACSNKDIYTYPASYRHVIGVKCYMKNNLKEGQYFFNLYPIDGIEVIAFSEHELLNTNLDLEISHQCNSYATPMITAKVCNIIDNYNNISLEKIKEKLYLDSINYITSHIPYIDSFKDLDWIGNSALVCINNQKEFHLQSFTDKIKTFKQIDDVDVNKFDTLILLNKAIDNKKLKSILYKFQNKFNNIIIMNTEYKNYKANFKGDNIKIWDISKIKHFYKRNLSRKKIDIPIIVIYAYTNNELLNLLRKLTSNFKKDGYYAAGICSESISILYNIEYIEINTEDVFSEIKYKLEVLYKVYDYDIILLGINVVKKNINIVKKINVFLEPDKNIFLLNKFTNKINRYIKKTYYPLIVTTNDDINEYSCLGYEIFNYTDVNSLYKCILELFIFQ